METNSVEFVIAAIVKVATDQSSLLALKHQITPCKMRLVSLKKKKILCNYDCGKLFFHKESRKVEQFQESWL